MSKASRLILKRLLPFEASFCSKLCYAPSQNVLQAGISGAPNNSSQCCQ
jgi:hypothetical protein